MLKIDRRKKIVEGLNQDGVVKVDELAEELGVSNMTIRRDLKELEENGILERTHGGATLVEELTLEVPYANKEILNIEEKKAIAKESVKYIEDNMVVGLDSGTTSMEISKLISKNASLTVITPDVTIASYLARHSNMDIICTGGWVQNKTGVCMGSIAEEILRKVRTDISFIATSNFTIDGITTPSFRKEKIKSLLMDSARDVILTVDSSKYGVESFVTIAGLEDFDLIIVDKKLSDVAYEKIRKKRI